MIIKGKVHCFFEQSGTFKNEFIRKIRYRLKLLIRGIGKTASLYYDVSEEDINDLKKDFKLKS